MMKGDAMRLTLRMNLEDSIFKAPDGNEYKYSDRRTISERGIRGAEVMD